MGYIVDFVALDRARANRPGDLVHVWLEGDVYPPAPVIDA